MLCYAMIFFLFTRFIDSLIHFFDMMSPTHRTCIAALLPCAQRKSTRYLLSPFLDTYHAHCFFEYAMLCNANDYMLKYNCFVGFWFMGLMLLRVVDIYSLAIYICHIGKGSSSVLL